MSYNSLGALCDDFYVNCRLFLKLDMTLERETVLHFFDRLRKAFPALKKLRRPEPGCVVLEEDAEDRASRRWVRLDPSSLRFGHYAPGDDDDVLRFGKLILQQAPFHLTFSDIDYDHLELTYGFDLDYCGNHDQLVAETLLGEHAATNFLFSDSTRHIIDAQPYYGVALSPEGDLQAYIEVKSRTSTYEVRSGMYENEPVSVFLTLRKYWGIDDSLALEDVLAQLCDKADEIASETVIPNFVTPLATAISSRR